MGGFYPRGTWPPYD
uniref:Uncharacterized protein n=1 Tax=mine drainage metagenome TaxID=410659 RepID=E6PCX9_9ZZZZ